ncbi:hypothetical protein HALLA_14405 [Halostagnicola larsenii XH-48]|uniref:Small CPxCG-related zinc finger protein n=1 Tax=Halostagnicola larsenii XH-48 TaxID=797299 RepID=W0JRB8_9EURY|nr:hypothetical protein [Halostagnicola larsenii]AHF99801.1 hypothetical protein HALLA_14405 [Halostagnicola larsenii XH-48]
MQSWSAEKQENQRCLCCGGHVTPEFRRGYGDPDDRAYRCPDCDTIRRLGKGSAAGKDIGDVDPLENPNRFGVPHEQPDRFSVPIDELPSNVRSLVESRAVATDGGEKR